MARNYNPLTQVVVDGQVITRQAPEMQRASIVLATHCGYRHEFTPENTNWHKGHRRCKACRARYQVKVHAKEDRERRREEVIEENVEDI